MARRSLSDFEKAFKKAREELGPGAVFTYKGKEYSTSYKEERKRRKLSEFEKVFAYARKKAKGPGGVFVYKGKKYSTRYKGEPIIKNLKLIDVSEALKDKDSGSSVSTKKVAAKTTEKRTKSPERKVEVSKSEKKATPSAQKATPSPQTTGSFPWEETTSKTSPSSKPRYQSLPLFPLTGDPQARKVSEASTPSKGRQPSLSEPASGGPTSSEVERLRGRSELYRNIGGALGALALAGGATFGLRYLAKKGTLSRMKSTVSNLGRKIFSRRGNVQAAPPKLLPPPRRSIRIQKARERASMTPSESSEVILLPESMPSSTQKVVSGTKAASARKVTTKRKVTTRKRAKGTTTKRGSTLQDKAIDKGSIGAPNVTVPGETSGTQSVEASTVKRGKKVTKTTKRVSKKKKVESDSEGLKVEETPIPPSQVSKGATINRRVGKSKTASSDIQAQNVDTKPEHLPEKSVKSITAPEQAPQPSMPEKNIGESNNPPEVKKLSSGGRKPSRITAKPTKMQRGSLKVPSASDLRARERIEEALIRAMPKERIEAFDKLTGGLVRTRSSFQREFLPEGVEIGTPKVFDYPDLLEVIKVDRPGFTVAEKKEMFKKILPTLTGEGKVDTKKLEKVYSPSHLSEIQADLRAAIGTRRPSKQIFDEETASAKDLFEVEDIMEAPYTPLPPKKLGSASTIENFQARLRSLMAGTAPDITRYKSKIPIRRPDIDIDMGNFAGSFIGKTEKDVLEEVFKNNRFRSLAETRAYYDSHSSPYHVSNLPDELKGLAKGGLEPDDPELFNIISKETAEVLRKVPEYMTHRVFTRRLLRELTRSGENQVSPNMVDKVLNSMRKDMQEGRYNYVGFRPTFTDLEYIAPRAVEPSVRSVRRSLSRLSANQNVSEQDFSKVVTSGNLRRSLAEMVGGPSPYHSSSQEITDRVLEGIRERIVGPPLMSPLTSKSTSASEVVEKTIKKSKPRTSSKQKGARSASKSSGSKKKTK